MTTPTPKKFRRGQRVRRPVPAANLPWMAEIGTVLNPNKNTYWPRSGDLLVSVRWDDQQADENGGGSWQSELTADTSGENQFEKRRYDLRWLSHNEIVTLREALEKVNARNDALTDEGVQAMLKKLPELPK